MEKIIENHNEDIDKIKAKMAYEDNIHKNKMNFL